MSGGVSVEIVKLQKKYLGAGCRGRKWIIDEIF